MGKHVKIKDIAQIAGVSSGTVDRILHNRGNVSAKSRKAVEEALGKLDYRLNIHTSAISIRRTYTLVIVMPAAIAGEYWNNLYNGIQRALAEYSDLKIDCRYIYYDQFDVYSCRTLFEEAINEDPDGVIIGPTFVEETLTLCRALESRSIPYVFVDSSIEGTHPIASFTTDQQGCGRLLARLLTLITPANTEYAVFHNRRIGNQSANNSVARQESFMSYMQACRAASRVHTVALSMIEPEQNEQIVTDFLASNPAIGGAVMLNSRGYVLGEILGRRVKKMPFVCFDLTRNNIRELRNGHIDFLLCQHPEMQGFAAVKALIRFLVYNQAAEAITYLPIDIVTSENVDYYRDILEL